MTHRLDFSEARQACVCASQGLLDMRSTCCALQRLQALRQSSEEDRHALERTLKERLAQMDSKMKDLRRKEKGYAQVERLKARSEDTCARLSSDIQAIKHQKVGLGACWHGTPAQTPPVRGQQCSKGASMGGVRRTCQDAPASVSIQAELSRPPCKQIWLQLKALCKPQHCRAATQVLLPCAARSTLQAACTNGAATCWSNMALEEACMS